MRKIKLPRNPDPTSRITGEFVIRSMVLVLPFWKNGSDLKIVNAALEIEDALDRNAHEPEISEDAHGYLSSAMSLNNGAASITEPIANRFYLRVFQAVLRAESLPPSS